MKTEALVRALGWFSIGLGAIEVFGGKALGEALGMEKQTGLLRAYGVREMGVGVGILTAKKPVPPGWLWGRFGGDVLDIATLLSALENNPKRANVLAALAAVGGVTALDYLCAAQLAGENEKRRPASDRPDLTAEGESYLTINRSASELIARWNEPETFAAIMGGFADVVPANDGAMQWTVHTPLNRALTWTSRMTQNGSDGSTILRWESVPGGDVPNQGTVRFTNGAPGNRGTEVALKFQFDPPGGMVGDAAVKFLGFAPGMLASGVLRRFKALIETGEIPTLSQNVSARGVGDTV